MLALLLHDVGNGMPQDDHVAGSLQAAEAVRDHLGMPPADRETIRFLITNHLEMAATIQRRDIFDLEPIRNLAAKVGSPERLKMLCLVTYGEIKAVSPEALTPWKAELLWQPYAAASNYLARSVDEERLHLTPSETEKAEHALARLGSAASRHDLERFLEGLPRRYLETRSPEEIDSHFRMSRRLNDQPVQVSLRSRGRLFEPTVLTPDRPFLFASITGTLAAWGMNMLKADAFANAAGIIVDNFRFEDLFRTLELNPSEIERLEHSLADVLT